VWYTLCIADYILDTTERNFTIVCTRHDKETDNGLGQKQGEEIMEGNLH
jgi:hypothetical protein